MASEGSDNADGQGQDQEPRECMACRGSGRVISKLGGGSELVTCPWCEGGGVRVPGIDAQARWAQTRAEQAGEAQPGD